MADIDKRRFVIAAAALSVLAGTAGSGWASEGGGEGGGGNGGEGGGGNGGDGGGSNGGGESGNGGGEGSNGGGESDSSGGESGDTGGGGGAENYGGSGSSQPGQTMPSNGGMGRGGRDQDNATRARGRNGVQPLARVLARAKSRVSGQVISVKFTQQSKGFFYDIKLISKKNRLVTVRLNAVTLRIISVRGN